MCGRRRHPTAFLKILWDEFWHTRSAREPWGAVGWRTYERTFATNHLEADVPSPPAAPPAPSPPPANEPMPLLTVRAAVILLLALLVGITAGLLTYLADSSVPGAVLAGGGATGAAIALFNTIIGR